MYLIIAGCGRVGSTLANTLSGEGNDVVVIDKDAGSFERLGGTFNGVTLQGVAFDEELLLEAGAARADAFLAVTSIDNTNIMAAEIASRVHAIPMVLSRLYYVEKELTVFKLGIDYICSTTLTSERFMEKLFQGTDAISVLDNPDVGVKLLEFTAKREAAGKTARTLDSGVNSRVVAILRRGTPLDISGNVELEPEDRIVVALRKEGLHAVAECLGDDFANESACRFAAPFPTGVGEVIQDGAPDSRVIVGGCSAVGAHLAFTLSMEGYDVTVVDRDPSRFERMPDSFNGRFVVGPVYDEETLLAAGIDKASRFAVLTKFDNANLMAAEVARHIFNVPKVVARLFNTDKESTYQSLGIDFVCGTRLLSQALLDRLVEPMARKSGNCCNNMYDIVEFECLPRWAGRNVAHFEKKMGFRLAFVARGHSGVLPSGQFVLREGDTLTAIMLPGVTRKLDNYLRKSKRGWLPSLS